MRLWQRLFLAFGLLSAATLAGFVAWQQRSFSQSFADYLDSIARTQAEQVAQRLLDHYRERDGWGWLREDPMRFGRLADPERGRPPAGRGADGLAPDAPPQPPRGRGFVPPNGDTAIGGRFGLYDADGQFVAGNPTSADATIRLAIQDAGQAVGELRVAPLPRTRMSAESDFARQQWQEALVAAAVVLLLALSLAFALAQRLRRPIDRLADGARVLAAGDYAHRFVSPGRDEIGDLARDFNRLAESLESNRRARQRWSADLAHELRTPLTVLRSELQLLADGVRPADPSAISSLQSEVEQLTALVEDLYQLSLADAGALEYRYVAIELRDVLAEALERHRRSLRQLGLHLDEPDDDDPLPMRGDPRRLLQAFDNLLTNAARYTEPPGRIRVSVGRRDGQAIVRIEDSPPGVSDTDLPRLFERLYRAETSRARAHGGSGLGLAICRSIIDAHAGSIRAQHAELGGLCIEIALPLRESA